MGRRVTALKDAQTARKEGYKFATRGSSNVPCNTNEPYHITLCFLGEGEGNALIGYLS